MKPASLYTRLLVFAAFMTFAAIGLASPMIVFFGVADLLGGMWTYFALKADAQSVRIVCLVSQDKPSDIAMEHADPCDHDASTPSARARLQTLNAR